MIEEVETEKAGVGRSTTLLTNENVEGMYQYQVFYHEEGTTSTDGMTFT